MSLLQAAFSFFFLLAVGCLGHSIEKREIIFQDVVRQRSLGNNGITQCPCVIHPESRQCIAYDSRYQAATIEEAILTFPDLTHDSFFPAPVSSASFLCQSAECQQCFGLLYYRLVEIGFLSSSFRPHIPVLPRSQLNPASCPRLKFPVPPIVPPEPPKSDYVRRLIEAGYRFMQSGGLRALPRQFNNRDRFRPGPRQGTGSSPPVIPQPNRNQQQHQQRPHQPGRPQQNPRPQTRPQNPGRQIVNNVWNAAARRWEQRPRGQGQHLPIPPPPNHNGQQGRGWGQQSQPPRQWPQQQVPPRWQQPQVQQPQPQQQFPQFQQPQPVQQQQQQQQVQPLQPQLPQFQQPQQPQWPTQAQPQEAWPQTWQQQQQQQPFLQPDLQQSFVQQALAQTHQAFNPLAQQGSFPFQGSQGSNGQGQGGVGVGGGGGGSVTVQPPGSGNFMGGFFGRKKRAVSEDPLVGRRFTIACIRRGEASSEDGEFLSLCGSCWTWRELPEDYFPRILNELSCQENDYCLSGWGTCKQQLRNVDVLKRVDGRWIPQSVTTATCCDCRVKAGTEIHALVLGDRRKKE